VRPADLHERAREALAPEIYDFFAGGAGDEVTLAENYEAWSRLHATPRVLTGPRDADTSITLLGLSLPHPIGIAPIAYQGLLHPEAEAAMARGAAAAGALNIVSTRSTLSLEDVAAAAPDAPRWFQVYLLRDRDLTGELARRAAASGYLALVLTGDTPVLGRKERDARNGFTIPEEQSRGNLRGALRHAPESAQDPSASLADIDRLRELSGLPVLVKGVLRADDARRCIEAGAAGLIVSNHGGRQLDGVVSTAEALPEVVAAAQEVPVLVDGGVDSAADVTRALALGADAVLIGRLAAWALAAGGAEAVTELLLSLCEELA